MMEPKNNDVSDLSQTSVGLMNRGEGQKTIHRKPDGLTITAEKIDRILADVQTQIELLRRERTNLGLARVRLAGMEAKWRSE
jgi:50S ribosomal subunit-associated GTPase HflX